MVQHQFTMEILFSTRTRMRRIKFENSNQNSKILRQNEVEENKENKPNFMKSVFLVVIGQYYIKERSLHKPHHNEMKRIRRESESASVCECVDSQFIGNSKK